MVGPDWTVGRVLGAFPMLYMPLLRLGLCCVTEETVMWTLEDVARDAGCGAAELCDKLNAYLESWKGEIIL